jgi:hypothetical protein
VKRGVVGFTERRTAPETLDQIVIRHESAAERHSVRRAAFDARLPFERH